MLKLILKDLAVARAVLFWAVPLFAAQLLGALGMTALFVFVTLLLTLLLAFGPIAFDYAQGTELLWCSLPVSRGQIVLARYSSTLLAACAGIALSWAIAHLGPSWTSSRATHAADLPPTLYAALFFAVLLGSSLFLPCYFRLGASRGLLFFSLLILALVAIATAMGSAIIALTEHSFSLASLQQTDPELLAQAEQWLTRWQRILAVGLVATALLLNFLSATLAVKLYQAREIDPAQ